MSENNDSTPSVSPDTDNLADFEALFNGKAKPEESASENEDNSTEGGDPESNDTQPVEDDPGATDEQSDADDDVDEEPDGEEEHDEDVSETPDEAPQPKKKKQTAKERIEELNAKYREQERETQRERERAIALEARLAERDRLEEKNRTENPELQDLPPDPDALGPDGKPLYPLGEIDPDYMDARFEYRMKKERQAIREEFERDQARAKQVQAEQALISDWEQKVKDTEQEIPDIRTKGADFIGALQRVDGDFAEFIAQTLMSLPNGPKVLAHLSDNPQETSDLVAAGPVGAALTLGRLDALFVKSASESEKPKPKTSSAPEPPKHQSRGTHGQFSVTPDTDDLEAFETLYYGKK